MRFASLNLKVLAAAALLMVNAGVWAQPAAPASPSAPLRELGKPEEDMALDVVSYQVDGLPDASAARLAAITAPFTGKGRNYEDLVNATAAVTLYMQRELGYYVGFAYLPEQQAKDGIVHIAVLEGRLDQVQLNWPDTGVPVNREVLEGYLAALKPGEVIRVKDIERTVFLVNDLQGVRTRFEIGEGREPGTASLIVTPTAEARVSGRIELDSLGSRYTGMGRISGGLTVASPTGHGDAVSVNALSSFSGGLAFAGVSYVSPVGASGLKLGAALSKVRYELDREYVSTDLTGTVVAASGFALYPLVRSRNLNVFSLLSYENKRFDDREPGTAIRKTSDDVQLGVVGDFRDNWLNGGVNTYELSWLQGRMKFDAADVTTTGLKRDFGKANLGYSRLQNLVAGRLQLYARYKGQIAGTTLDATERFAVGGPTGVRAYAPGEAAGDTAHVVTTELRFLPPEAWVGRFAQELAFSTFYDWGHAKTAPDSFSPSTSRSLSGYGVGMIWARPSDFALRLNLAWRATGEPLADNNTHQPRANAVLTKNF
ncbi:ShlB/FhaC/HecB family hemolysin secretion/activation protein [Aquabacterium sp. CECT 9606]|uniref:ShlB/FhaC/HecB family hemolysin secretion/activation protein n=1 Tax=Aquabacterium sp. CECT 9606 TaxID=2845822 RepID=UPI001E43E4BA|nr:ShlB/FhaC/HecB family hemolysin secretion/activation protein [Aquabacterium sp. CECT 9606]CAH0355600.1 Heme/hemopexin transporter protein HuxB [Aquabacterium sp. CECT 9606]